MTFLEFLLLLVIAGVCGAIGKSLAGVSRGGIVTTIAVGFVGALLGAWLARLMGLPDLFVVRAGENEFPIIWSIIGSALFVALLSLLTRRTSRK